MKLIDGKNIASKIKSEIADEVYKLREETDHAPHLAAILEIGRASCRERV